MEGVTMDCACVLILGLGLFVIKVSSFSLYSLPFLPSPLFPCIYYIFSANQIIVATPNNTNPQINITSPTPAVTVTFSVSVREIRERNKNGDIISSFVFGDTDITVAANIQFLYIYFVQVKFIFHCLFDL
jgi:hypothetical protein